MSGQTADQDYFLDDKRELTTDEGKAALLLIRKGQEVPQEMADKYGIGKVAQKDEATADTVTDDESEKAAEPSANKAKSPGKNKGAK